MLCPNIPRSFRLLRAITTDKKTQKLTNQQFADVPPSLSHTVRISELPAGLGYRSFGIFAPIKKRLGTEMTMLQTGEQGPP